MRNYYFLLFLFLLLACNHEKQHLPEQLSKVNTTKQKEGEFQSPMKSQFALLSINGTQFNLGNSVKLDLSTSMQIEEMDYLVYEIVEENKTFIV